MLGPGAIPGLLPTLFSIGAEVTDSYPFCVGERPYVLWSASLAAERGQFLNSLDTDFYDRWVHLLMQATDRGNDLTEEQRGADHSSMVRLLWHHGMETLLMLLGAFMQAPSAPHAYFVKCRSADVLELADSLLSDNPLRYMRLTYESFTLSGLLMLIHKCAPWAEDEVTSDRFWSSLVDMLADYTMPQSRWEYNGIKHGLRARHGRFLMRVGVEETHGVAPPEQAFRTLGYFDSSSAFHVPKALEGATKQQSRVNFALDHVTVPWSLDRALCELRIISMLANNVASALKVTNGATPDTCRYLRMAEQEWWDSYQSVRHSGMKSSTFGVVIEALPELPSDQHVHQSYERGSWSWLGPQDE